jgi:hypothetical protein
MSKNKSLDTQTKLSFQLGGVVPMPGGGIINTPNTGPTTGFTPYVAPVIPGFTRPQLQNTQYITAPQTTNLPTFGQVVGTNPGQYDELRRYVNDAGQVRQIPFKNGQPIYPIPEGYRYEAEEAVTPTDTTTVPTTVVGQDDDRGGDGNDGVGVGAGTSISGYPGRTGVEGLQAGLRGITDYGSYDLSTPASENPYGVTGSSGFNLGAMLGVLTGNPLSALASVSGIREPSMVGAYGPTAGFPGTLDRSTLDSIATGKGTLGPLDARQQGFSITQEQARAAVRASNVAGVDTISGRYGYNPGDAIPGVKDGFMHATGIGVNVRTGKLTGHYKDIASFVDRMSMTREEKAKFDRELASEISVANMKSMDFSRSPERDKGPGSKSTSTPSSPADYGAMSPEDVAGMFDDDTQGATGMGDTGTGGYGGTGSGVGTSDGGGGYGDGDSDSGSGTDGGNSGGSSGGASGGCFEKGTLFKMADGTTKCIEDIKPGDKMYKGGLVYAVMQGDGLLEDWYNYNGVHVTSGHPVLDNGTWKRVGETESKKAIDKREIYYSLMNSDHLMISENGTEFTDFVEIGADIGGRSEWMMDMLNQKKAA